MTYIRQLCPELAIKARLELSEVENRIPKDIETLREWIQKQNHLTARTSDQFLLTFLRGAKYSLEKAKKKIDYYYTIKSISQDTFLFKQIDEKVLRLARLGPVLPLPKPLGIDGPRIILTRYGHINPNEFTIMDLFKNLLRIIDIQICEDDHCVIAGVVNIVDMASTPLRFYLQFDPVLIQKMGLFADKAAPLRVAGIHLINIPKQAASLISIAQSLLPGKLKERMSIHSSLESLYKHIPQKYLPKEYGGENGRIRDIIDSWEKHFVGYKEYFAEDVQYGVNEKLRVERRTSLSLDYMSGLDGSFRKLEVD